jgi:pimeloyl-ACP methyl ester carboxylesterase
MRREIRTLALLALAVAAMPAQAARQLGSLTFEPCTLSAGIMPEGVDAQCTTLSVPEDRAKPDGRQIKLAIAWVPSEQATGEPDPVFMLAGGPGQAAREAYPMIEGAFRHVLKTRNVILVDQRGTGASNPLVCKDEEGNSAFLDDDTAATDLDRVRAFAAKCLAGLDADPRFYTTSDAVLDLDAVRTAIGADKINLLGVSYGTRVAQEYLRRYPAHTRALVLDGVAPPSMILGVGFARNLEDSLDKQFARCEGVPVCKERFGSARQKLDTLMAQLRATPVSVTYRDPLTAETKTEDFTADHLASLVRLFAYDPRVAAMLPLALAEAGAGRFETLMQQAHLVGDMMQAQLMHGMQLSVVCAEDAPLFKPDPADASTTLGEALSAGLITQCEAWPRGRMPEDFHTPVTSDVPVLLTSGEFDPVTPPRYGDEVAKTLTHARHLVLRGRGHNVIGAGCMPRVLDRFLRAPLAELDAKCIEQLDYIPPFAGFYGPEP